MPTDSDPLALLLHELSLPADAAELRHFVQICRRSPRLRAWLFGRFAKEADTQADFRRLLAGTEADMAGRGPWSPVLMRQIASDVPLRAEGSGPHGGLSETRVIALIKRYQAGRVDVAAFLFVRCWMRFSGRSEATVPVALWQPTLAYWTMLMRDPTGRMARSVADALRFFHERSDRIIGAADFGFTGSWKIHVLIYILDYPKPCYRVGELRDNLPVKYRHVGRKEVREFCKEHGICRDTRPGERPASLREKEEAGMPTPDDSGRLRPLRPRRPTSSPDDKTATGETGRRVIGTIRSRVSLPQRNAAAFLPSSAGISGLGKKGSSL